MIYKNLEHRLSPAFPKMRMMTDTIGNIVGLVITGVLFWLYNYFAWPTWAFWILIGLLVLCVLGTIWSLVEPKYIYRSWSYQLDDEYLQLRYGIFKKEWVTVPMTKIQSVSTSQSPMMKRFQIRSIKVETMGSSHVIPGLEEEVALRLREKLAKQARLKEVDE